MRLMRIYSGMFIVPCCTSYSQPWSVSSYQPPAWEPVRQGQKTAPPRDSHYLHPTTWPTPIHQTPKPPPSPEEIQRSQRSQRNQRRDSSTVADSLFFSSESSLFVAPHLLILKTCGTTLNLLGLHRIIEIAREYCGFRTVWRCFYSRKSFFFPERQQGVHKDWRDEVRFLDSVFGTSLPYSLPLPSLSPFILVHHLRGQLSLGI